MRVGESAEYQCVCTKFGGRRLPKSKMKESGHPAGLPFPVGFVYLTGFRDFKMNRKRTFASHCVS